MIVSRLEIKTLTRASMCRELEDCEGLPSTVFRKSAVWTTTFDNGLTRFSTMADPYPTRSFEPQNRKYGDLAGWGFGNSDIQLGPARNPEIYQWNLSFQHQLGDT